MENPFKFGTIVEEEYFTDRVEEVAYIEQFVKSSKTRQAVAFHHAKTEEHQLYLVRKSGEHDDRHL
jgi:hypothetical protein